VRIIFEGNTDVGISRRLPKSFCPLVLLLKEIRMISMIKQAQGGKMS